MLSPHRDRVCHLPGTVWSLTNMCWGQSFYGGSFHRHDWLNHWPIWWKSISSLPFIPGEQAAPVFQALIMWLFFLWPAPSWSNLWGLVMTHTIVLSFYLFTWPGQALVAACGIFLVSCGIFVEVCDSRRGACRRAHFLEGMKGVIRWANSLK